VADDSRKREPRPASIYPWLRRDAFKATVSYVISLAVHAAVFFLLLATVIFDGGGGPGDAPGGKGDFFSTLVGHGELDHQTERTDDSKSLQEEIARAVEQIQPLPVVPSEVVPELDVEGVQLATVTPKVNPIGTASSLRNLPPPSTGGGMAVGPGTGMGGGIGGGIGRGFGRGFGDFVGLMQRWGFDVVFVIDGTNSMQFAIDAVKTRLRGLVGRIQAIVPNARVGFVIYKDKGDDFTVRMSSLSFHADKLQAFINSIQAGGGGDYEEAVYEGMRSAIDDLDWRKYAHRAIVLVPSSPPHKAEIGKLEDLVREFHAGNGVLHVLDLSDMMHRNYEIEFHTRQYGKPPETISPLPDFLVSVQRFYAKLADETGGETIALAEESDLTEDLMIAAFGPQWRKEVSRFASSD
jgi:hypothetical protein